MAMDIAVLHYLFISKSNITGEDTIDILIKQLYMYSFYPS